VSTRIELASGSAGVGPRIRAVRKSQSLSLRVVSDRSGLSVGFLSQVERELSSIALTSLQSVADALGVTVAALFEDRPADAPVAEATEESLFTLTRAAERRGRVVSSGRHYELLSGRAPGLVVEPMLVYIEPGGTREPSQPHPGEEFAFVLSGELVYEVDGTEYRLTAGDSFYMRSTAPHSLFNDGTETTVFVAVVTPRHF
jgi:quercetin dioxygenase-like cupin family protein